MPERGEDEQQPSGGALPRKKVLLASISISGHLVHFVRIAERLAADPGLDVHLLLPEHDAPKGFGVDALNKVVLPEGVKGHFSMDPRISLAHTLRSYRALANSSTGWENTAAFLTTAISGEAAEEYHERYAALLRYVIRVIDIVVPDIVVADGALNSCNLLHGRCRIKEIPLLLVSCNARPVPIIKMLAKLYFLLRHAPIVMSVLASRLRLAREFAPMCGPALADKDRPVTLLPGSAPLVRQRPRPHELFVGPLVPLSCEQRPCDDSANEVLGKELFTWLRAANDAGEPVIYVSFGSVVLPCDELVARLAEALEGGPWRVLWSLPNQARNGLPKRLRDSRWRKGASQWRLEFPVLQQQVLECAAVRCFVSHCGASSTHEALSCGVPMVCMPFLGDQYHWAESICKDFGAGILLDKNQSSAAEITAAVTAVVGEDCYREQASLAARQMYESSSNLARRLGIVFRPTARPGADVAHFVLGSALRAEKLSLRELRDAASQKARPIEAEKIVYVAVACTALTLSVVALFKRLK